jgi:hypothetical protein
MLCYCNICVCLLGIKFWHDHKPPWILQFIHKMVYVVFDNNIQNYTSWIQFTFLVCFVYQWFEQIRIRQKCYIRYWLITGSVWNLLHFAKRISIFSCERCASCWVCYCRWVPSLELLWSLFVVIRLWKLRRTTRNYVMGTKRKAPVLQIRCGNRKV